MRPVLQLAPKKVAKARMKYLKRRKIMCIFDGFISVLFLSFSRIMSILVLQHQGFIQQPGPPAVTALSLSPPHAPALCWILPSSTSNHPGEVVKGQPFRPGGEFQILSRNVGQDPSGRRETNANILLGELNGGTYSPPGG